MPISIISSIFGLRPVVSRSIIANLNILPVGDFWGYFQVRDRIFFGCGRLSLVVFFG